MVRQRYVASRGFDIRSRGFGLPVATAGSTSYSIPGCCSQERKFFSRKCVIEIFEFAFELITIENSNSMKLKEPEEMFRCSHPPDTVSL